jgi:hypothetical protein
MHDRQRAEAAEIERDHPDWLVMWGCYSRMFWAFPRFPVPRGEMASAPTGAEVLNQMLELQAEFLHAPPVPVPRTPLPPLPLRRSLARRRRPEPWEMPVAAASSGTASPLLAAPPLLSIWPEPRADDTAFNWPRERLPPDPWPGC